MDRSSIQLPAPLKRRLLAYARRQGYRIQPGPGGQTADFIAWLLDQQTPRLEGPGPDRLLLQFAEQIGPGLEALRRAARTQSVAVDIEIDTATGRLCIQLTSTTTQSDKPTRVGLGPETQA
jgi:hypothetical protein